MANRYTKEQTDAINTDGCDLLVAAAAGSGKTAVLVERIIRLIAEPPAKTDIDRLLIVTFTDAAAGEMRLRISEALSQRQAEFPEDDNLRKQLNLLNKASITTIHSFCLKVIRRHFHLLDVDPNFRVADDAERRLIKSQVLAGLFEDEYAKNDNEDFFRLVESFGGSRTNDGSLEELVLDTFEFACSHPQPELWLEESVSFFDIPQDCSLDETVWAEVIRNDLKFSLLGARECNKIARELCVSENGPVKYLTAVEADREIIDELLEVLEDSTEGLYDAAKDVEFSRLPVYSAKNRGDVSEVLIERFKYIRDVHVKKTIKKAADLFEKEPPELLNDIRALLPILNQLKRLVLEFSKRYTEEKKERNILDFNDLEHFCLKILMDGESDYRNPVPSKTAKLLGESFYEILTDEYQDTNLIQELILSLPGVRRFMVGDVKQSIYKFRRAEPGLFIRKYKSFAEKQNGEDFSRELGIKIDLSMNFRSRQCVTDAVNFLFSRLMCEETGGIIYDDKAALYCGADYPSTDTCLVSRTAELAIIEREGVEDEDLGDGEEALAEISELADIELEAGYITRRIKELVAPGGLSVFDKQSRVYRPARYGDIVILLRSARSNAETVSRVLEAEGIPTLAETGGGYFDSVEISSMLSLLQIIDNPRQDIHLLAVLRSPGYMLNSDELLDIHCISPTKSFFDCITEYISEGEDEELRDKLRIFTSELDGWREEALYTPISELIGNIYEQTGFLDYAAFEADGAVRVANLRMLQERALQYEKTSYKGLFHFIRYIEKLQKTQIDRDNAKILSENDDLVKIMTIHKSKGLEFPIVFVSGLGKRFNTSDTRKNVIMHQELGFGPYCVDLESRVKSRTLPHIALGIRLRDESIAEELRVLYVAATRAKEKLIFTGCVKNYEKKYGNLCVLAGARDGKMPAHLILSAGCFLDWIIPVVSCHKDGEVLLSENGLLFDEHPARFDVKIIKGVEQSRENHAGADLEGMLPVESGDRETPGNINVYTESQIIEALEWEYPRSSESGLPVKVSISEIKRRYQAEILTDRVVHIPESLRRKGGPQGADIGTAMHTVMEHLDIRNHRDGADIKALIQHLTDLNVLEKEAAAYIEPEKILNFVNSSLADRIRESGCMQTEVPFVMALTPYEVFGKKEYEGLDSKLMLHGIIDCFFDEGNGFVLVDYKSDRISRGRVKETVEKYRLQLSFYARAIESMFGKPVVEVLLYLFSIDEAVRVEL